jgi:hypothetical protein
VSDNLSNENEERPKTGATVLKPSPADFPLGSLQSRAAARIMYQQMMRNANEQEHRKQVDMNCAAWTISHK